MSGARRNTGRRTSRWHGRKSTAGKWWKPVNRRVLYIGSGSPWIGGAGFLVRQNLFLRALVEVAELHLAMFDCSAAARPDFPCELTPLPLPLRKSAGALKRLLDDCVGDEPRMFRGYD